MMVDKNNTIKEKVRFYLTEKTSIHINLASGKWANGVVVEVNDSHFILDEEKLGRTMVLFGEVEDLEPRRKKEDEYDYRSSLGEGVSEKGLKFERKFYGK